MPPLKKSLTEKFFITLLCAIALMAVGPTVAGYARALVGLPIYGAACSFDKLFGSNAATPDEYRSFLLGYGCNINAAIHAIVTASGSSVDPRRIIAIYHGALRAETGDELSTMSTVRDALRHFAPADTANSSCPAAGDCAASFSPPDYSPGGLFNAYLTFARAHFLDAADDGADYIADTLRMGPTGPAIVLVAYAAVVLVVIKKAIDLFFLGWSALARKRPRKR